MFPVPYIRCLFSLCRRSANRVMLKVKKMTSTKTLLPLEYYRFPFCQPPDGITRESESLGQFLSGDRIESSPYFLLMKIDMYCEQLCFANLGRGEQPGRTPNKVVRAVRKNYHNNWIVDDLPAASRTEDSERVTTRYWQGFPIGFVAAQNKNAYIHNHVNIEIMYHEDEAENRYHVVRFVVEPFSIKHDFEPTVNGFFEIDDKNLLPAKAKINNPIPSCNRKNASREHTTYEMVAASEHEPQLASGSVLFTYDVTWIENKDVHWSTRWDIYLTMDHAIPAKVHWLSIVNSLIIIVVLSAMIAAILVRNIHRDIARYNKVATDEARAEELEEYGWKLVHADVFRPPSNPMALAVTCGTGAHLLCMSFMVICFSALGVMSPVRRGHLILTALLLFVSLGAVNGYVTARLYKTFKGKSWQSATTAAALVFPGAALGLFCIITFVPYPIMITLILLGISTPLVFLGAFFGFKQDAIEFPVNTSSIQRQIPNQPWFMGLPFTLAFGGILPFGSCFVELYYILASVWMDCYYVFGCLFLVFVILMVTCAEITVLFTYFQLCSEDYRWWWRSFSNAGSMAIYVFLYSIVYFKQLEANTRATYAMYFGYMGLASAGLFTMMGCVGVLSSLWFNKTIFESIKID